MTAGTGFAGTNMLGLVRQQDNEFNTLPFAGFRERKGVFACRILDYCFFVWTMVDLFMRENMHFSGWMDKFE